MEETSKKEVQNAEVKKLVLVLIQASVLMISVRTSISVSERESILSHVYIGLNKYIQVVLRSSPELLTSSYLSKLLPWHQAMDIEQNS